MNYLLRSPINLGLRFFLFIFGTISVPKSSSMKILLLVLTVLFSQLTLAQTQEQLPWMTNLEAAQKQARKEKKPVLLYFTGSDWCAPCIQLKEDFFSTDEFKTLTKDYLLVMIDIPRRIDIVSPEQLAYNKDILKRYNPERSFPMLIAYNHKGRKIGEVSGYSSLRDTFYHFELLEKIAENY